MAKCFQIVVEDRGCIAGINQVMARAINAQPAYEIVAQYLQRIVDDSFAAEGARPGFKRWWPLSPVTIRMRLQRRKGNYRPVRGGLSKRGMREKALMKILQDKGYLRASIKVKAGRNYAKVGSSLIYAATHQLGRGAIPARPFIQISDADKKKMSRIVMTYIMTHRAAGIDLAIARFHEMTGVVHRGGSGGVE